MHYILKDLYMYIVHVSDYRTGNLNTKNKSSEVKNNKVQKVQITDLGLSQSVYLHNDFLRFVKIYRFSF